MNGPRRAGFSLLEVLLAMSILLGSLIVLSELAGIGRQHTSDVEGLLTAQLVCQTKLNEILSGAAPAESYQKRPVAGQLDWTCSVEIYRVKQPGVAALRVTVWHEIATIDELDPELRKEHEFSLVRWIRDPSGRGGPATPADPSAAGFPGDPFGGGGLP